MTFKIHSVENRDCDVWIGETADGDFDYCYGGTRLADPSFSDTECEEIIRRLMREESGLKNSLINHALHREGQLNGLEKLLPAGYLRSRVGGGRCIIRPKGTQIFQILSNPFDPAFVPTLRSVMEDVGKFLNSCAGRIKLTPDFGRFEGVADILAEFTPHVLGIACADGGCGGKSSYTVTGITAVLEKTGFLAGLNLPVTLIGSAGALGTDLLRYLMEAKCPDLAVCDLQYDISKTAEPPAGVKVLRSSPNRFTDETLERGGWIIAATYGGELQNSSIDRIPENSRIILAHNLSLPDGREGYDLARAFEARSIQCIPGQMLTFGGALTSRLEWFQRQAKPKETFQPHKPLAHQIVREVANIVFDQVSDLSRAENVTLYEAVCRYGGMV